MHVGLLTESYEVDIPGTCRKYIRRVTGAQTSFFTDTTPEPVIKKKKNKRSVHDTIFQPTCNVSVTTLSSKATNNYKLAHARTGAHP